MSCYNVGNVSDYFDRAKSSLLRRTSPAVTPTKVSRVQEMAVSNDPNLRAVAAGSPVTPVETLTALADDPDTLVRSWAVRNPSAGEELLTYMTYDSSPGISAFALFRLGATE